MTSIAPERIYEQVDQHKFDFRVFVRPPTGTNQCIHSRKRLTRGTSWFHRFMYPRPPSRPSPSRPTSPAAASRAARRSPKRPRRRAALPSPPQTTLRLFARVAVTMGRATVGTFATECV